LGFTENIYQHLKATFWEKEKRERGEGENRKFYSKI